MNLFNGGYLMRQDHIDPDELIDIDKKCTHNMPIGCCMVCIAERKAQDIDVPYEPDPQEATE